MKKGLVLAAVGVLVLGFTGGTTFLLSSGEDTKISARGGHPGRAWLGVSVQDVSSDAAKEAGLKSENGAYVRKVLMKSPADSAGMKNGDIIVEFNGRQIYDADGLVSAVRKVEPGKEAKLIVQRKGEKKEFVLTLRRYPKKSMSFAFAPPDIPHRIRMFRGPDIEGLRLIPLNPQLGKYFEAPEGKGLLVEKVEEGSAAEKAGFKAGDVILKVGGREIEKPRDVRAELADHEEGDKVDVEILRKGSRKTLTIEIQDEDREGFEFFMGNSWLHDDIDVEVPDIPEIDEIELHLDGLRPELERLRIEMKKLEKNFLEKKNEWEKRLKQELGKRFTEV